MDEEDIYAAWAARDGSIFDDALSEPLEPVTHSDLWDMNVIQDSSEQSAIGEVTHNNLQLGGQESSQNDLVNGDTLGGTADDDDDSPPSKAQHEGHNDLPSSEPKLLSGSDPPPLDQLSPKMGNVASKQYMEGEGEGDFSGSTAAARPLDTQEPNSEEGKASPLHSMDKDLNPPSNMTAPTSPLAERDKICHPAETEQISEDHSPLKMMQEDVDATTSLDPFLLDGRNSPLITEGTTEKPASTSNSLSEPRLDTPTEEEEFLNAAPSTARIPEEPPLLKMQNDHDGEASLDDSFLLNGRTSPPEHEPEMHVPTTDGISEPHPDTPMEQDHNSDARKAAEIPVETNSKMQQGVEASPEQNSHFNPLSTQQEPSKPTPTANNLDEPRPNTPSEKDEHLNPPEPRIPDEQLPMEDDVNVSTEQDREEEPIKPAPIANNTSNEPRPNTPSEKDEHLNPPEPRIPDEPLPMEDDVNVSTEQDREEEPIKPAPIANNTSNEPRPNTPSEKDEHLNPPEPRIPDEPLPMEDDVNVSTEQDREEEPIKPAPIANNTNNEPRPNTPSETDEHLNPPEPRIPDEPLPMEDDVNVSTEQVGDLNPATQQEQITPDPTTSNITEHYRPPGTSQVLKDPPQYQNAVGAPPAYTFLADTLLGPTITHDERKPAAITCPSNRPILSSLLLSEQSKRKLFRNQSKRKRVPWTPLPYYNERIKELGSDKKVASAVPRGASSVVRIMGRRINLAEYNDSAGGTFTDHEKDPDFYSLARDWVEDSPHWTRKRRRCCKPIPVRPHPTIISIEGETCTGPPDTDRMDVDEPSHPAVDDTPENDNLVDAISVLKESQTKEDATLFSTSSSQPIVDATPRIEEHVDIISILKESQSKEDASASSVDEAEFDEEESKSATSIKDEVSPLLQDLISRSKEARTQIIKKYQEDEDATILSLLRKGVILPPKKISKFAFGSY